MKELVGKTENRMVKSALTGFAPGFDVRQEHIGKSLKDRTVYDLEGILPAELADGRS